MYRVSFIVRKVAGENTGNGGKLEDEAFIGSPRLVFSTNRKIGR